MIRAEDLVRFWGFNTQGDFGPWTFYTDQRKGLVFFLKAPPLEPPSLTQTFIRNQFRTNAYVWRSLPVSARRDWETAAKRAHLKIHGFNLFTFCNITKDDATIHTIERITNINLIPLQGAP